MQYMENNDRNFESLFQDPDEVFHAAVDKGIIQLGEERPFQIKGLRGTQILIQVLKPKGWIDFLQEICDKTKNPGELSFASDILTRFKIALLENRTNVEELETSNITDEKLNKLKNINYIQELLDSIEKGEL